MRWSRPAFVKFVAIKDATNGTNFTKEYAFNLRALGGFSFN